jgi:hypothetical protein
MNETPEKLADFRYIILVDNVPIGKSRDTASAVEIVKEVMQNTDDEVEIWSIH